MRDLTSEKGVEKGGILDVFPLFQSAFLAEKIRCSAADDLFRVSLARMAAKMDYRLPIILSLSFMIPSAYFFFREPRMAL